MYACLSQTTLQLSTAFLDAWHAVLVGFPLVSQTKVQRLVPPMSLCTVQCCHDFTHMAELIFDWKIMMSVLKQKVGLFSTG